MLLEVEIKEGADAEGALKDHIRALVRVYMTYLNPRRQN
jgi:hypothetical protein